MRYLNQNQNREAYKYQINQNFQEVFDLVVRYSKTYGVSLSEAIEDLDFPVTNENRQKIENLIKQENN